MYRHRPQPKPEPGTKTIDDLIAYLEKQPKPKGPRPKPKPLALTYGIDKALELIRMQLKARPGYELAPNPPRFAALEFSSLTTPGVAGILAHLHRASTIDQDLQSMGATPNRDEVHNLVDASHISMIAPIMRAVPPLTGGPSSIYGVAANSLNRAEEGANGVSAGKTSHHPSREQAYFEQYLKTLEEQKNRALRELFPPDEWHNQFGSGPRQIQAPISRVEIAQMARSIAVDSVPHRFRGLINVEVLERIIEEIAHKVCTKYVANLARQNAFG